MSLPSFGSRNPVPANLLMMVLIVGGIWSGLSLRREFFPEIDPEAARVELIYPGATPNELERRSGIYCIQKSPESRTSGRRTLVMRATKSSAKPFTSAASITTGKII